MDIELIDRRGHVDIDLEMPPLHSSVELFECGRTVRVFDRRRLPQKLNLRGVPVD